MTVTGWTDGESTTAVLDALARSELLPGLGRADFAAIGDEIEVVHLDPGEQLVGKGESSDRVFVVVTGTLEAVIDTAGGAQHLAAIEPRAVVGEIGVLASDTRSATVRAVDAAEVASISAVGLQTLLAAHPKHAEELARRATERLRRAQVIEHFTQLVGVIEPDVLATIEELTDWVTVPAGTQVFAQGDDGDSAYLVAAGRLRVYRRGDTGAETAMGEIGRGELVGEMSLFDGEPRGASVYAVRDSHLIRLSRAAFDDLLGRYPRVGLEIARIALHRARSDADRATAPQLSVVVVPISPSVDGALFCRRLAEALGPDARVLSSSGIDDELGRQGIAQIEDDDVGALRLAYHLEETERRHGRVVFEIDDDWTAWSRRALRWADHVLLVGDAERDPTPGPLEQRLWTLVARQHHPRVSLALLHPPSTTLPNGTAEWLDQRVVTSHHHLRRGDDEHMARLARLLAGTGTSVVLGGGGARGFAQLGILGVLEQQRVPIDMIGGASIGAIMAIGPAMEWSMETTRTTMLGAFRKLFDYTLPTTSLLRGERISAKLRDILGEVAIEDLWIPYFCVSTNLTHARADYLDRGSLVRAVRASIAIPGVLPPVPLGGDLLVDGGVLDNVPVEEMRRRNPTGSVIAIDVAPVEGPVAETDYGLSVSGFRKLVTRHADGRPPNLLSTMVRSSILASVRDRQRVVRDGVADLYLDVDVDGGAMLDFSEAEDLADAGATSAREALVGWLERSEGSKLASEYVRTPPARRRVVDTATRTRRRGVLLLTVRDLQHRATRFAAVVVGVSVVFSLLFLMTGLTEQFQREPRDTVDAFGAAAWLVRDGVSGAFTSAATMPADTASLVEGATAEPVVVARHTITDGSDHTDVVVVGYRSGGLGEPEVVDGRLPRSPEEVVVDDSSGLDVGDEAQIGDERYLVAGLTHRTTMFAGMPLVYLDLSAAQSLLYRGQDLATAVLLDGVPDQVPDGFGLLTSDEVATDAMRPLSHAVSSVNLIRVLLWFVAAMIIGTMTYLSALERRRDVAVLKAVGGSTLALGASIALQGALVALIAAVIASALQGVLAPAFPLEVSVPSRAFVQVPLIAVVVALLAGGVGLRKAVGTDPALAFSGPGS